jgi:hypothetical protein
MGSIGPAAYTRDTQGRWICGLSGMALPVNWIVQIGWLRCERVQEKKAPASMQWSSRKLLTKLRYRDPQYKQMAPKFCGNSRTALRAIRMVTHANFARRTQENSTASMTTHRLHFRWNPNPYPERCKTLYMAHPYLPLYTNDYKKRLWHHLCSRQIPTESANK